MEEKKLIAQAEITLANLLFTAYTTFNRLLGDITEK